MKRTLKQHLENPVFEAISKVADRMGVEAYVIGGFVRDLILKRESKDIDVVVVGSGIDLARAVAQEMGIKVGVKVFKNFGTAMLPVKWQGERLEVEFVGARKESYRRDSRKPIVENGSLEDDQNRRDLTINALAINLSKGKFGDFVDPFDGISDLENRIIRTPLDPDITFDDDPLRMMRAIRFATQLDFFIEEETLKAIERNKERIKIVSKERITDELNKMILAPRPSIGFKLLQKSGLLALIFPKFVALKGTERVKGRGHKDNFYHTLEVLDNLSEKSDSLWLRWTALLHDIAKPRTKRYDAKLGWTFHGHEHLGAKMVPGIFRELRLPLNDKMKYVQKLVALHLRPQILSEEMVTDSAVRRLLFDAGEDIEDLMTLCEADITSKNQEKVKRYLKNFNLVRQKLKEIEEKDRIRNWQPPVSGEDIMKIFNIAPGREVGIIKNSIREAILDGVIPNQRHEALVYMIQEAEKIGLEPAIDPYTLPVENPNEHDAE